MAWGIYLDIRNVQNGGSIDLRNRVTGSRIALTKENPYTYKWQRWDPPRHLDIYNPTLGGLSKTTNSPWALAMHTPLNRLNYRTSQWLWLLVQYGALLAGITAWLRTQVSTSGKIWGIGLVLCFCLSPAWRHHIDRGQIYVIFSALLFLLYWLSTKRSTPSLAITEGMMSAFTFGCRPTFLGPFFAPLNERRWLSLAGVAAGGLIVFLLPVLFFGSSTWEQYRQAMEIHSDNYLHNKWAGGGSILYPHSIEGIPTEIIAGYNRAIPYADTSFYKTLSLPPTPMLALGIWALLMTLSLVYMIWRKAPTSLLWWAISAWIVLGDFLLPALRHTYNDVLCLPMVLFGISAISHQLVARIWLSGVSIVLLMMICCWWQQLQAEWILTIPSLAWAGLAILAIPTALYMTNRTD